jgi:glycosyltransferase involved in cell wall biosynthesis
MGGGTFSQSTGRRTSVATERRHKREPAGPGHVLFVIESLGRGGAEESTKRICASLVERGVRCTVAHLFPPATLAAELEQVGAEVVWLGIRSWRSLPLAVIRLARLERRVKPEIVHSHLFFATIATALAGLISRGSARVATLHNVDYDHRLASHRRFARKAAHRLALRQHQGIVAVTDDVADHYVRELKRLHRPEVIANPVIDRPSRVGTGIRGLIVCPARLIGQKRHDRLVEAFSYLYRRDQSVKLKLAGDGPLREDIQRQIEDLGLAAAVELLGEISQTAVLDLMSEAHVVALASDFEGFGMGVADAMVFGVPVVITNVPGLRTLVDDGKTGLSVAPDDVGGFATALESLISDEALATRIGRAGREDMRARFSSDSVTDRLLALYAGLAR